MEKLSEISLGRRGVMVEFGSLFVFLYIGLILFFGFYMIKIPLYADVEIVASESNIFLVSNVNLNLTEKVELEDDRVITVALKKVGANKYELNRSKLSPSLVQNLKESILTDGKILMEKQNFFQSLLPFF